MAGFGDSNDIKINVTLDTEGAIKSAEELKKALESGLKSTEQQFKKIEGLSKSMSAVLMEDIKSKERIQLEALKNEAAAERRRHLEALANASPEIAMAKLKYQAAAKEAQTSAQQQVAAAQRASDEKMKADQREADNKIKLKALEVRAAEAAAREKAAAESTLRTQILKNIADINQATAKIKKTPTGGLGNTAGDGKLVDALKNSIAGLSFQFGNVNVGFASLINNFKNLGVVGGSIAGVVAAVGAIQRLDKQIDELAAQAGKVEGLSAGFNTLQKTIGQDPTKSIELLRQATRGLVSDVDLYQRANQAVLLGVPTKVFNEAAAAAVKLGRAMGVDASFGLESLSLGLGRQSRLYLDNLGIIVSAEEAYKNFGASVGKSANDLTDAEKKAAFFAEALKKIKERAEELPEPIDTVGTSLQRLQSAQENANTKFSDGFNSSQFLVTAYKEQAAVAEISASVSEKFGIIVGNLSGVVKRVATDLKSPFVIAKVAFVEFIDLFADLRNSAEQAKDLENALTALQDKIKKLVELRDKMKGEGFTLGNPKFADVELALSKAQEEAKGLRTEILLLRGEGEKGIKINVDNSEVIAARSQISNLFSDLKTQAERSAGIFKVPGIGDPQSAKIFSEFKTAKQEFDNSLKDTAAVEKYTGTLKKLEQDVSAAAVKSSFATLAKDVTVFTGAVSSGQIGKAKETFASIKAGLDQISKGASVTKVSFKDLEAGFKGVAGQSQKITKPIDDTTKAFKQQQQQLKELTKSLGRSLGQAIPKNVQQKLLDVFNEPQQSAEELRAKIEAIGEGFLKAGGDYQAFAKEVKGLNDLKNEMPDQPLRGTSESINEARQYNKELAQAQEGILNIRKLIYGDNQDSNQKAAGGAFFGFDLGKNATQEMEAQIAGQFQDALAGAFQAGADGFSREDVPGIAASLGSAAGAAIAASIGVPPEVGAAIGSVLGQIAGEALAELGKDLQGTAERKQVDKYFGDLFDPNRLSVVIQGQIHTAISNGVAIIGEEITAVQPELRRVSDLIFEGFTPFAGQVQFGGEGFFNYFNTLAADVQNAFTGVGLAIGTLQGVSAETARLIGTALSNNIGGSLQNLQVLVQQTGESFEDLSQAILKAFRDSQLTAEEAYNALVQLQNIYSEGIPGAVGDFQQAIDNLNTSLKNEQPGQYALDSLRDIGAEGKEAGAAFTTVVSSLGQTFGFAANQQARLFEALRASGIASLNDLAKASDEQLLTLIRNINAIKENAEAPLAAVPQLPSSAPRSSGSGRRGKSPQEEAEDLLKKQREEARKLTQESQEYLKIIDKINNGQLTSIQAGKEIKQINADILKLIKDRDNTEKRLNAELDKGTKGNAKTIAELSKALADLEERLGKVKEKASENKREYKDLNISAVIPLIKSQNTLGLVARQIGVDLKTNVDILVKGFLQGRMSIKQVNDEINKTKELLGPGIPNSVGAVTDAFQNLIDAGTQGGSFSVDAFTDIFAEFREKFAKEGSAFQQAQRKILNDNLDSARQAVLTAVGPEATEAARKALELAKKAIEDFKNTPVAPDLSDLRDQLRNSFNPEDVEKFFQALDESGLKSFEELENASAENIIKILGRLEELGFSFNETSQEASGINQELQNAEQAANAGLDPLKEAINLVKAFNDGAALLPPVFNSTTEAIDGMEQPLANISDKIAKTVVELGKLGGNKFENEIVFNVRTTGEQGGQALVNLIFGDGSSASSDTGNGNTTPPKKATPKKETPASSYTKKDFKYLSPGLYRNLKTGRTIKASERAKLLGLD